MCIRDRYIDGANSLADGTTAYVKGAEQLAAGASQLSRLENLGQVSSGISQLNAAISKGKMCIRDSPQNILHQ